MIQHEVSAPVYFARWSPDFEDIIRDLQHSFITDDKSGTALEAMMNTVSSNGYQIGKYILHTTPATCVSIIAMESLSPSSIIKVSFTGFH